MYRLFVAMCSVLLMGISLYIVMQGDALSLSSQEERAYAQVDVVEEDLSVQTDPIYPQELVIANVGQAEESNTVSVPETLATNIPKKLEQTPKKVEQPAKKKTQTYQPNRIYFNDRSVAYRNGGMESGQHIIDKTANASTWGGAAVFSGTDGKNTHFIGHNNKQFRGIEKAESVTITDKDGHVFVYEIVKRYQVDDYGVGVEDGVNYFEAITSEGSSEQITLQTCLNGDINWILIGKLK